MLSFFFNFALSLCDQYININQGFHTYRIELYQNETFCLNLTQQNTHLFIVDSKNTEFDLTYYNKTLNKSDILHFNSSNINVPIVYNLQNTINISAKTLSATEPLIFISAQFPTHCYNGLTYLSNVKGEIRFNKEFNGTRELKNFDDKCVIVYGYNDSIINVSYSIDSADSLKILSENGINEDLIGKGSVSVVGEPIGLAFWSDFSVPSDFINISASSDSKETNLAMEGVYLFEKSRVLPDKVTQKANNVTIISITTITVISVISVAIIVGCIILIVFCVKRPKKDIIPDEIEKEFVPDINV